MKHILFAILIFCSSYSYAQSLHSFHISENGKRLFGLKDENDKTVIPPTYAFVGDYSDGLAVVLTTNRKFGYINEQGVIVIPPNYKSAGNFSEGLAVVSTTDGMYGYINKQDSVVIPFIYDEAYSFGYDMQDNNVAIKGLAFVNIGNKGRKYTLFPSGKWGMINHKGEVILPIKYGYIYPFNEGMSCILDGEFIYHTKDGKGGYYEIKGKYGFIDSTGSVVIPPQYDSSYLMYKDGKVRVSKDGKDFIIDKQGNKVADVSPESDQTMLYVKRQQLANQKDSFCYIYTDRFDHIILPDLRKLHQSLSSKNGYKLAYQFSCGRARIMNSDGKWQYLDTKGNVAIDASEYDYCWSFEESTLPNGGGIPNHAIVNKGGHLGFGSNEEGNGKYGLIDTAGNVVLPVEYDAIIGFNMFPYDKIWWIKKDGLYGAIDENIKMTIPMKYKDIRLSARGLALVKEDSLWEVINTEGKTIIPPSFSDVYVFSNKDMYRRVLAKRNGLWGIIDIKGKTFLSFRYKNYEKKDSKIRLYNDDKDCIVWDIEKDELIE